MSHTVLRTKYGLTILSLTAVVLYVSILSSVIFCCYFCTRDVFVDTLSEVVVKHTACFPLASISSIIFC